MSSELAPQVQMLREIRDNVLWNNQYPILSRFPTPRGWQVDVLNTSGQDIEVSLYAMCNTNS